MNSCSLVATQHALATPGLFWSVVSTTCRSLSQTGCMLQSTWRHKAILVTLHSRKLTWIWKSHINVDDFPNGNKPWISCSFLNLPRLYLLINSSFLLHRQVTRGRYPWMSQTPVVPARGGAEVALDLIKGPFSSIELARAVRRACLLRANLLRCCWLRTWPACDHFGAQHHETCTAHLIPDLMSDHLISSDRFWHHISLHKVLPSNTSYYKACTNYFPVLLRTTKLAQRTSQYYFVLQSLQSTSQYYFVLQSLHKVLPSTSQYYFVLQSLHKLLPSTTWYYKACTKHFSVLLRTTKLAQSTSQYYSVLQSLHKILSSTTSYYKACTKYFPVLLRTTKLAQSTSQYYFVLQSLHNVLPSTTSYYKACTKYVPVLLRTTKLAHSTSQYYFVLQRSHKVLPSTTSYYKTCTKYLPILLCTQTISRYYRLAENTSQYYLVLQSLHKVLPATHTHTHHLPTHHLLTHHFLTHNLFTHLLRTAPPSTPKLKLHYRIPTQLPKKVLKHYRSLNAATPLRFTMPSCKRQ